MWIPTLPFRARARARTPPPSIRHSHKWDPITNTYISNK